MMVNRDLNKFGLQWGILCLAVLSGAFPGSCPVTLAEQNLPTEYELKAAFIYSLLSYVEWPTDFFEAAGENLSVCILGQDPFGANIDVLQGKLIDGHPISITRISEFNPLAKCHVLFISSSEQNNFGKTFSLLNDKKIFTIADMAPKHCRGTMVVMNIGDDNRLRFKVNLAATESRGFKIRSRVLRLVDEFLD